MKTTKRVRTFLTAAAATVVLAGAGIASVEALDSDGSGHEAPALRGGATDAAANVWEANDCAVLLAARGENVSPVC